MRAILWTARTLARYLDLDRGDILAEATSQAQAATDARAWGDR